MDVKVAAVGDKDSVLLFRSIGIAAVIADTAAEARRAIRNLDKDGCAVIYITEQMADVISDTMDEYRARPYPAIIPIPGRAGATGAGMKRIRDNVVKAVGKEIF